MPTAYIQLRNSIVATCSICAAVSWFRKKWRLVSCLGFWRPNSENCVNDWDALAWIGRFLGSMSTSSRNAGVSRSGGRRFYLARAAPRRSSPLRTTLASTADRTKTLNHQSTRLCKFTSIIAFRAPVCKVAAVEKKSKTLF